MTVKGMKMALPSNCTDCHCHRLRHEIEPPYYCMDCNCLGFSYALDYDCERHGKGRGSDCPTCSMSDAWMKGNKY